MFLRIANPGVADPAAFTLLGVTTSRDSDVEGVIGQFGSGSKHAVNLLLRNKLQPVIISGNLTMSFNTKPRFVGDRVFQQVIVKYSGKDLYGQSKNSAEDLGYTLSWGEADWYDLTMAPREFVANAIDGCLTSNHTLDTMEIGLVDSIRAKKGWTQVYIPVNDEIMGFYTDIDSRFLHFKHRELLKRKLLPKIGFHDGKTRIYKKGVLVHTLNEASIWDYNLGDELTLDESRNANVYTVKGAIAKALSEADAGALAVVIKTIATNPNTPMVEQSLDSYYLRNQYGGNVEQRRKNFQEAFAKVAGENGVVSSGLPGIDTHLEKKGLNPVVMPSNWLGVLSAYGVKTENEVLTESEKVGETIHDATPEVTAMIDKVWGLIEKFDMTNGKEKPTCRCFYRPMNAGTQRWGYYKDGVVSIHTDIASGHSEFLAWCVWEELGHHCTDATDMSRDFQTWFIRFCAKMGK